MAKTDRFKKEIFVDEERNLYESEEELLRECSDNYPDLIKNIAVYTLKHVGKMELKFYPKATKK